MDNPHPNHSNTPGSQAIAVNGADLNGNGNGDPRRNADALVFAPRDEPSFQGSGYAPSAREEADGMDLQRILAIIMRRWPTMLAIFVAATAIGAFTAARSKAIYQASSRVELNPGQQSQMGSDVPGLGNIMNRSNLQSIETQMEIMRGSDIMNRAFAKVSPQQRQTLSQFAPINITQVEMTRLLDITVQSYNPDAAAALANSISNQYIAQSEEKNSKTSKSGVRYVENELKRVGQSLSEAQSKLRDYKERTGIFSISEEATALAGKSLGLQKDIEASSADRQSLQAKLAKLQTLLARVPASKIVTAGIQRNPRVTALQSQLADLQLQRTIALGGDYKPTSFKVKTIDSQIAAIKGQLQGEARTIVSGWQPDPSRAPLAADAAASQSQLWSLDARINALKSQSAQAQQNLQRLPQQEFQFSQLSNERDVLQNTYQLLNTRLQGLRIGEQGSVADASVANRAFPSPTPVAPNKPRTIMYAMAVGLLAALGIGLLLDMMDNHIYSEDDVQRVTGLPVLVQVPLFSAKKEHNLLMAPETQNSKSSPLLETFRMLRTNIRLSGVDKTVRSVTITSSVPHEGKSNTALSLAVAAATSGDRVVLVDLDLRRPSIHQLAKLPNEVGFTSVLTSGTPLEKALQDTAIPGLQILTSGPLPPNPFRLLNSQSARALIEQIAQNADLVIIDTPPVLTMADALLISSWVDGALLVASSSEIRKKDVARAAEMLTQNNNDVLGVVLTKVNSNVDGYYSYYGYKNYNHYFESKDAIAIE